MAASTPANEAKIAVCTPANFFGLVFTFQALLGQQFRRPLEEERNERNGEDEAHEDEATRGAGGRRPVRPSTAGCLRPMILDTVAGCRGVDELESEHRGRHCRNAILSGSRAAVAFFAAPAVHGPAVSSRR
jgi:hypothetical protein